MLERLEAGVAVQALLDGHLLTVGVAVQVGIAVALAVLLTLAGRVAEAAGRALRRPLRRPLAVRGRVAALVAGLAQPPAGRWVAGQPPPHPARWSFADATVIVGGAGGRAATSMTWEFP